MAAKLTKSVDEATDQVVGLIEQAQEAATSVVANVSEVVARYVPELGLGEVLPTPEEAVESSFRVGDRFVETGRKATLGMIAAVAPVTEKVFGTRKSSPKAVAKSA